MINEVQSEQLAKAEKALKLTKEKINNHPWKLQYHVMPQAGWMNDPNGFSFFKGEYHLFYQHHPYDPTWGPMYWGHVKSKDLANWEHLPVALAPSEDYDKDGCFSGSAIEKDGKLYLIYTGNVWIDGREDENLKQVQALAVSEDGIYFEKPAVNPVIKEAPSGDINTFHFRDPKVWLHEGIYYMVLGSKTKKNTGQALFYRSADLIDWEFISVMAKGEGNFGFMWECPDLFTLDGKEVLIMSPQGVEPEGNNYHNLHQAGYVIGELDYQTGKLQHGSFHLLDHGFDFYAPQTMVDENGRRILIAWMDMWESDMPTQEAGYAGAMTLPRLVERKGEKLYTTPVPELQQLRGNMVKYNDVKFDGNTFFPEIEGNCLELDLTLDTRKATKFGLKLCVDEVTGQETVLEFNRSSGTVMLNRERSGKGPGGVRKTDLELDNQIHLRIFLDKSSVEVFINRGEKVMSARIFPDEQATGITFFSDSELRITDMRKWDMKKAIT